MLRINGEITTFLDDIEFATKEELMEKLRNLRKAPNLASNTDYQDFYNIIGVAIQQAYYTNPKQIERYKKYCEYRKSTGANNGQNAKNPI
ncbi:MAG: hypothetical protein NC087_05275 [Anaeroplasma bactoclasticum]|nr:hypothetical protein [Anaeroplasma bactoclasticum]